MAAELVYKALKSKIERGELKAGDLLPGEGKLCQEFRVARETVRTALRRLTQDRYLAPPRRGCSRAVQKPDGLVLRKIRPSESFGGLLTEMGEEEGWTPHDLVIQNPTRVRLQDLVQHSRMNPGEIASKLSLRVNSFVLWFGRLRFAKGEPVAIQWVVVPANVVTSVTHDDLYPGGLTRAYRERYGITRSTADAQFRPALASFEEGKLLQIEHNSPLIEERRVSYCARKQPHSRKSSEEPYEYLVSLYANRVTLDFRW